MKKVKVVHISTVHHPLDTRIFYKQCTSLANAGYDVTLIIREHNDLAKVENTNFRVIPMKSYSNRFDRIIKGSIDAYKTAEKIKADIYHFHDPELIFAGRLLKKKNNCVIYDIHEDYDTSISQKKYISKPLRKLISKTYTLIEKIMIKKFHLCLAEKYYKDKYTNGVCILNYPIIDDGIKEKDVFIREVNKESNVLIYTGNVTLDRGAIIHSKIPSYIEGVNVKFVGKCNRDMAEVIYQLSNGNDKSIELIGIERYIPREEIDSEYNYSNLLAGIALFPISEHYAKKELTKFFEYMYAGLPIICSNFPAWKKFVDYYKCGIAVDPANDEEIKDAIEYLRNNPAQANIMGNNGRRAVLNELNWKKEEEKLIKWYDNLIKSNGSSNNDV